MVKKNTSFDAIDTLHGIIIPSTMEAGSILGHSVLEKDEPFIIIDSHSVVGSPCISVYKDTFPLFASHSVKYIGEPVLALFGPDLESTTIRSKTIEIEYQNVATSSSENLLKEHSPIEYMWNNVEEFRTSSTTSYKKTYIDEPHHTKEDAYIKAKAWIENDILYVKVPTQWPFHVQDSVASVCSRTKKSVVILGEDYNSAHDEKLLIPSIIASIAALAALKSMKKVILYSKTPTYKSQYTITRETILDELSKPIAENVDVEIDQGAYPLFSFEMVQQMIAGLLPLYPLKAFHVSLKIVESHTPPSHFFGSLGYTSALFSTEAHASAIAQHLKKNPANWRIKEYSRYDEREGVISTMAFNHLKDLLGEIIQVSDFSRHHAVYSMQSQKAQRLSTFLNYSRGIGIACGAGISGFSLDSALHRDSKIEITLENNNIIINSSFYPSKKTKQLWYSVIAQELSVDPTIIHSIKRDTSKIVDSGPEVLSLDVARSIEMIRQVCTSIKSKRFQEPLPISASVSAKSTIASPGTKFISQNWGCLTLEIEIDTVTLTAFARRVYARFLCTHVMNNEQLCSKFRHIIYSTLNDFDLIPIHNNNDPPIIDIKVTSSSESNIPSSATQSLRAMIYASYVSALSSATGKEVSTLPYTSKHNINWGDDI